MMRKYEIYFYNFSIYVFFSSKSFLKHGHIIICGMVKVETMLMSEKEFILLNLMV